jgi:hypothetical protein
MSHVGHGWRSGQAADITGAASTCTTTAINPTTAPRGGGPIVLTVSGTGFTAGTVIYANYSPQVTVFVNASTLRCDKFSPLTDNGLAGVIVVGARKGTEALSNVQNFTAT